MNQKSEAYSDEAIKELADAAAPAPQAEREEANKWSDCEPKPEPREMTQTEYEVEYATLCEKYRELLKFKVGAAPAETARPTFREQLEKDWMAQQKWLDFTNYLVHRLEAIETRETAGEMTADQLAVDICRELYDRFVMGGWQPEESHGYVRDIAEAFAKQRVEQVEPQRQDEDFERPLEGDWVQPIVSDYRMSCCDCGLIHSLDFRVHEGRVQFRAYRISPSREPLVGQAKMDYEASQKYAMWRKQRIRAEKAEREREHLEAKVAELERERRVTHIIVAQGEGAGVQLVTGEVHEELHKFMCCCGKRWENCETQDDIRRIDDSDSWSVDEDGQPFGISWDYETGTTFLYSLGADTLAAELNEEILRGDNNFDEAEKYKDRAEAAESELREMREALDPLKNLPISCGFTQTQADVCGRVIKSVRRLLARKAGS